MDSYQFYKSIYDRELTRRKDLDSAINLPLTILSILVAANSYLIKQVNFRDKSYLGIIGVIVSILIFGTFAITIFFLTQSYNNFFKGFAYRNLGLTTDIRNYEIEISKYNNKIKEQEKIIFENVLINKITSITDNHIILNDKRMYSLYVARTFIIVSMILTAVNFILITFKNIKYD
jgi:hypothetical protein